MNKLIQIIKCKLGLHTWQEFILKPYRRCIYCGVEDRKLNKKYGTAISLTGFSAMRKESNEG